MTEVEETLSASAIDYESLEEQVDSAIKNGCPINFEFKKPEERKYIQKCTEVYLSLHGILLSIAFFAVAIGITYILLFIQDNKMWLTAIVGFFLFLIGICLPYMSPTYLGKSRIRNCRRIILDAEKCNQFKKNNSELKKPQETTNKLQNNKEAIQSKGLIFIQNTIQKILDIPGKLWQAIKPNMFLNILVFLLTLFAVFLAYYDIPNYPLIGNETFPTKTQSYIDNRYGNYVIYEFDYTVKYSKWSSPEYNISIFLPIKVDGYIDVNEAVGRKIDIEFDAPNDSVNITNMNKINPLLLHINYVSEESINPELLVNEVPLPDIQNNYTMPDSFFVKVKNSGRHDIKTLRYHSNVTKWMNVYLKELRNASWINQSVIIYDGSLPVEEEMIDDKGILTWEINSLNSGEQKVYYFKKIMKAQG